MTLPFTTDLYDTIYANISVELREKYPQTEGEDVITWYKRLLYEFMSYLQTKYEPLTVEVKVKANKKNNRKKSNPPTPKLQPQDEIMFDANIERALDIVSQDSNCAVYLLAWWLPLLLTPADHAWVCLEIDCSATPAENVALKMIEMEICVTHFSLIAINGIPIETMTKRQFAALSADPFIKSIFKALEKQHSGSNSSNSSNSSSYTQTSIKQASNIVFNGTDYFGNTMQIANVLWSIKNVVEPLFILGLSLKSNLIPLDLMVTKEKEDRHQSKRKRFNSRRFIKTEETTPAEMSAGVLQTLAISVFRTFYDYDASTIEPELFDYLFKDQHDLTF